MQVQKQDRERENEQSDKRKREREERREEHSLLIKCILCFGDRLAKMLMARNAISMTEPSPNSPEPAITRPRNTKRNLARSLAPELRTLS